MQKRWLVASRPEEKIVASLMQSLNISEPLAILLAQRNVSTFEQAKTFFRPGLDQLHDPFLMKDMEKAVIRLNQAIEANQKILVYGDYDVDGTTAVTTFYGFMSELYDKLEFYIPDRYAEGYGVSRQGIQYAIDNDFSVIVTLDCGIKACDRIADARNAGIDVIICDHHTPGEELPPALAVLDPKRFDCMYPYEGLSGCGVGFKLLHAFCLKNDIPLQRLYEYLDLLAVSIASDIVPITGENRVMAYFGLKKLNSAPRPGLKALIDLSRSRKDMTISGVVFGIGPRINAAGRMEHAGAAVKLLLAKTEKEALVFAGQVDTNNDARRDFDSSITEEALQMIETNEELTQSKSTVLYKEDWHKGVIGIVASRCIEKFYRPTVILTESNDKVTGSARSVQGFDVYSAISECADLLEQYGGHMYAAGVTMGIDKVDAFKKRFEEVVSRDITEDQLTPSVNVDTVIFLDEINFKFYKVLSQMGPFGPQNMQPVFVSENLHAINVKVLKDQHLKFHVKQEGTEAAYEVIGFGLAEYHDLVYSGMKFHMAYTIEENDFRGHKSLQLFVKDLKFD
jgi:single-stranded-DNA-specific exonuclease